MIYNLDRSVNAVMFGKVSQSEGCWHSGKRLTSHLILYLTEGKVSMQIGNETCNAKAGDILLIPKGVFYKPLESDGCQYYFFHFQASTLPETEKIPDSVALAPHMNLENGFAYTCTGIYASGVKIEIYTENVHFDIKKIFDRGAALRPDRAFSDKLLLDNLVRELLILLSNRDVSHIRNKKFLEILDYINSNYASCVKLSSLSQRFSLSESYISRLFNEELSMKPSEYINRIRISAAISLLVDTDITISEIAEKCGYSGVYYFSRIFKKMTGASPMKIRNSK